MANGNLDYPRLTKLGIGSGLTLFAVGALGLLVAPAIVGPLPAWEQSLLFDAEALGVVITLLSPFVFGIMLPLIE
ncbi:hypothetical protein C474_11371 [Halogeometricum pallidum JCM 14848]|uniref:MFS transporter n=1 Tax=Halogeometricum pallidum JCM 14848 TaxID=1227487 RepID=M0D8C4_HALPD|nr:hypothetical protein [Halogeometricum pallidum]ELZ30409.1 hypothetical protein C474_11371 [Halogeometricum pallidum JCM 14848]